MSGVVGVFEYDVCGGEFFVDVVGGCEIFVGVGLCLVGDELLYEGFECGCGCGILGCGLFCSCWIDV